MKSRPYNPQFARPVRSRRQREDDAVERDIQSAARNARYIEAMERDAAAANKPVAAPAAQQDTQGEKQNG